MALLAQIGMAEQDGVRADGEVTAIQPDTGAPSCALNGTTSEPVMPASIVTVCLTDPKSLSRTTECSPGVSSAIVTGDVPRASPSTLTRAPAGSVRTCS